MAVINRTTLVPYTNEINHDGVATQVELETAIQNHLNIYHKNEEGSILIDGVEYYFDSANNRYISKEFFRLAYSDNDTTTHNIYLYQKKNIRCNYTWNTLPFGKDILIDRVQVSLDRAKSGNIFDIRDQNNTILKTINIPTSAKYTEIYNFNLLVSKDTSIRVYNKNITTRRPLVTLWMKLIHV